MWPLERTIHLPAGFLPAIAGSYLQIAIRPRAGWYPTEELATEIGLLAMLAWLLAFGTHDLTHSLLRLRAGLAASRRRVQALTQRLCSEIEQRQDLQKSFDHARYHDGFTGLPNRRYFMNQLDRALVTCAPGSASASASFSSTSRASDSSTIRWGIPPAMSSWCRRRGASRKPRPPSNACWRAGAGISSRC